ncbi:hypothetical protein AK812_SmicGene36002 [Symbiodinium microadriaticum]|uniref:Uncharacterized protein n=1 Tax=Symbiodinium microadriaticum TaxID=2951 RepID=A0A1Q9CK11_SYMMI|nr:hypothetical protein AK812_SmicGene36002 [Symbiodinium microadriaticum]
MSPLNWPSNVIQEGDVLQNRQEAEEEGEAEEEEEAEEEQEQEDQEQVTELERLPEVDFWLFFPHPVLFGEAEGSGFAVPPKAEAPHRAISKSAGEPEAPVDEGTRHAVELLAYTREAGVACEFV